MLSTSFALRRQLAQNTRLLVKATLTLANGTVRNLTNDDIMMGSLAIKDSVSGSSSFDIGAAIIGRCNITLNNYDERFDDYDFTDARLEPYIGAELPNGNVEWLKRGVYHVDQPDSYGNSIGLESLDNMTLFEVAWETVSINLPATCGTIVQAMCNSLGVTLNTPAFAGYSTVVPATTDTENMTALEMLSAIAQITGNFARFDAWGRLNLGWYPTSCYEGEDWYDGNTDTLDGGSATANGGALGHRQYAHIQSMTNLTVMTDDVVITGVRVTAQDYVAVTDSDEDHDGETYLYGTDGYVLEIVDNKLVPYGTAQAIATQVGQRVVGMRFRPLRLSMTLNPALEAGDAIIVTDGRQRQYRSYVTSLDFRVGSYEGVSCDAESPGRHTANSRSAATRAIVDLRNSVKREKTARENAIDSMGQRLDNASGLYETQQVQQDGSIIYYMHDKPTLNESMVIMKVTAAGVGISTDGGQTYPTALDVDGDAILRRIYAIGLDADYINTGRITVGNPDNPIFFADFDTQQVGIGAMGSVGGRTAEEVNQLIDSSATSVDVEYNQNQSTSVAPAQDDSGWQTTAPSWRQGYYIWQRVKTEYANGDVEYSSPTCISGRDGSTGTNAATIYLYQKKATKPSGIANQITYYFENGAIDGSLGSWSRGIPEGDETCWVTVATAIGNGSSDVIAANEWSDPVQLAAGGVDGLSQATIYLFKRSNTSSSIITNEILFTDATVDGETAELLGGVSGETLTLSSDMVEPPSTALTYTFETGVLSGDLEGWSRTVPPGDGVIWVTTAVAISSESTDTIAANEWAVPAKLAEDGISVTVAKVEYAVGTSGTTVPTTGWVEHVPTVAQGMWLWSKMTESDGTELLSVSYQGTDGEDGISVAVRSVVKVDGVTTVTLESSNGQISTLTIADGDDGDTGMPGAGGYVHVAWANSADGNTDFSTTVSTDKLYMGVYTDQTEADSQAPSSYTWTLIKGEDGRGIVSTTISYAASSSGSSIPSTGWQSTIPSVAQGQWLWVRNVDTYTDNTTTTTYSKSYQGTDGEDGTSVNIVGSSKTGGVTTVILEDASGQHTLRIADGEDGDDGAAGADGYTHFAYATSADGSQGFSTTESTGKSYIGVYADHTQADSQRYQDYTWSLIKGADGYNGSSTAVVMLYKRTSAGIRIVGETLEADEGTVSGETLVLAATVTNEVLEASFASLTPPSGNLTYTFETGVLSGNLQGWSQTIPAGREPCYVISATATSTGPTDTIAPGEWADAALIADNGTSVYVSSIHYAVSMTETQPTSGWSTSPPAKVAEGAWLWVRVTYSDGNMSYSRSKQGESGTSTYTHIRYSVNANGNPMVATPTEETCYIGIFVGTTTTAPDTYGSYTWSRYAGADGINSANIMLYKRSASTPAAPTTRLTYTFATATVSGSMAGWTQTIPSGTDPCWVISANAVSTGAADTIDADDWSSPVKMAANGYNQAIIRLYKRSASSPALPSATLTYTFASGALSGNLNGWSRTIPATNGTPCWVTQATAISTADTDTIASGEWVTPAAMVEDGYNQATLYLYVRGTATPTKPSAASTYNFSTGVLSPVPTGWSRSIPSGTAPLWQTTAIALSTTTTDSIAASNWSDPVKVMQNGDDGVSAKKIEEQYYLSTSNTTQSGGSWSTTMPTWVSGKYIWTRTKTTWDTNPETYTYTTPILAAAINDSNEKAKAAQDSVATLDRNLYAREVYNRLTHDNANQGVLYDSDGSLYVNATYINTGILTVTNGSKTVFSANLDSGAVSIDADVVNISGKSLTSVISGVEASYGTCGTASSTAQKQVNISGFIKYVGKTVTVRFTNSNTASNPTLYVYDSSKPENYASGYITINGSSLGSDADYQWKAGDVITFVWTGSQWAIGDGKTMSQIKQTIRSIELSVSNATLGSTASIMLEVDGSTQTKNIDLTNVREAFKNDTSAITISAGIVTFNSNTFVVNSTNFSVTSSGVITAKSGTIGGFTITSSSIYYNRTSHTSLTSGVYMNSDGISSGDGSHYISVTDGAIKGGRSSGSTTGYIVCDEYFTDNSRYGVRIAGNGGVAIYGSMIGFGSWTSYGTSGYIDVGRNKSLYAVTGVSINYSGNPSLSISQINSWDTININRQICFPISINNDGTVSEWLNPIYVGRLVQNLSIGNISYGLTLPGLNASTNTSYLKFSRGLMTSS